MQAKLVWAKKNKQNAKNSGILMVLHFSAVLTVIPQGESTNLKHRCKTLQILALY